MDSINVVCFCVDGTTPYSDSFKYKFKYCQEMIPELASRFVIVHTRIGRENILQNDKITKIREEDFKIVCNDRLCHFFIETAFSYRGNTAWQHDRALAFYEITSMMILFTAIVPVAITKLTVKKTGSVLEKEAKMRTYYNGMASGFISGIAVFKQVDLSIVQKFLSLIEAHVANKAIRVNLLYRLSQISTDIKLIIGQNIVDLDAGFLNPTKSQLLQVVSKYKISFIEEAHAQPCIVTATKEPNCVSFNIQTSTWRTLIGALVAYTCSNIYNKDELEDINCKIAAANLQIVSTADQIHTILSTHNDVLTKYKDYIEEIANFIGALSVTYLPLDCFINLDESIYKNFDSDKIYEYKAKYEKILKL